MKICTSLYHKEMEVIVYFVIMPHEILDFNVVEIQTLHKGIQKNCVLFINTSPTFELVTVSQHHHQMYVCVYVCVYII